MKLAHLFVPAVTLLAAALSLERNTFQPAGVPFTSPVTVAKAFSAHVIFSNLTLPRGITKDERGNVLVVERGVGITVFSQVFGERNMTRRHNGSSSRGGILNRLKGGEDLFHDTSSIRRSSGVAPINHEEGVNIGWDRHVLIANPNFTHGIALSGRRLYASTGESALIYSYDPETKSINGTGRVIVANLPADGELTTHPSQVRCRITMQIANPAICRNPYNIL